MTDHAKTFTLEEVISGLRKLRSDLDGQYDGDDLLGPAITYLEELRDQLWRQGSPISDILRSIADKWKDADFYSAKFRWVK